MTYPMLGGPGEALFVFMLVGIVRAVIGLDWVCTRTDRSIESLRNLDPFKKDYSVVAF